MAGHALWYAKGLRAGPPTPYSRARPISLTSAESPAPRVGRPSMEPEHRVFTVRYAFRCGHSTRVEIDDLVASVLGVTQDDPSLVEAQVLPGKCSASERYIPVQGRKAIRGLRCDGERFPETRV